MAFGGLVPDEVTFTEQSARDFWAKLDEKSKLALAKTAPRVATSWLGPHSGVRGNRCWSRSNALEDRMFLGVDTVATVDGPRQKGQWRARLGYGSEDDLGWFPSAESAKSAVDAQLREMGFVLEDGE